MEQFIPREQKDWLNFHSGISIFLGLVKVMDRGGFKNELQCACPC